MAKWYLFGYQCLLFSAYCQASTRDRKLNDEQDKEDQQVNEQGHLREFKERSLLKMSVPRRTVEEDIYLVVPDGSVQPRDGDKEQEDAARCHPADNVQTCDDVGGLAVGRYPDQQKGYHLETDRRNIMFDTSTMCLFVRRSLTT